MEYCSHVELTVNGQTNTDFKSVTEHEVEYYKQFKLMGKVGHVKQTQQYGVSVDYAIPKSGKPFDFKSVVNGTLSYKLDNGQKITFKGVYILKIGEAKMDGENEQTRTIELGAEDRIEE